MTSPDWRTLLGDPTITVHSEDTVLVELDEGRQHHVRIVEQGTGWALRGRSAAPDTLAVSGLDAPALWARNRHLDLVGYSVGQDGFAAVTAWLPHAGATPEEFAVVTREVAAEADRLEFYCSGQDEF